ncbi:unnamed protein product [marine sediment metagenome]|uniref:Uncharacterized protein n=1 Tax=marine sediment metagenome TaxID=412755 RepID=X1TB15_9ZZZZ
MLTLNRKKKKEGKKKMHIPGVKPIHRFKLIVRPNMREFAVLDMKTAQRVSTYLPREEAEEKARELTVLAISEEKSVGEK